MPAVGQSRYVRVGGTSPLALRSQLADAGIRLNQLGEQLISDPRFITETASSFVEISCVTVSELGFTSGAKFDEILARASTLGLEACPLEVAAQFRLQYIDQPEGALGHGRTEHRATAPP